MRNPLNTEQVAFIKKNYRQLSRNDIAKLIHCTAHQVKLVCRAHGWEVSRKEIYKKTAEKRKQATSATAQEDLFIQANYLNLPIKRMGTLLGRSGVFVSTRLKKLGLVIPPEVTQRNRRTSWMKPGHIPANKGKTVEEFMPPEAAKRFRANSFKKGHNTHNAAPRDGEVRIRKSKDGRTYKFVRISLNRWELLHKVEWEKLHGPVPKGMLLSAIDGDSLNTDPENWTPITRTENMRRNSGSKSLSDGYEAGTMTHNDPETRKILLEEYPELIKLKREQLILTRTIKKHGPKQNSK